VELTNADLLQSLQGPFAFISLGADVASIGIAGVNLGGVAFIGASATDPSKDIFGVTLAVGLDVGLPAGVLLGIQRTTVDKFNSPLVADPARWAWDAAAGLAPLQGQGTEQRVLNDVATFLRKEGWGASGHGQSQTSPAGCGSSVTAETA
jgi:hypothetical protein